MKTRLPFPSFRRAAALAAMSCWIAASALAQSTGTGAVRGLVSDGASGTYLAGAQAALGGTDISAPVGPDGAFVLADVPAGNYSLTVSYVGYDSQAYPVTVQAGQTVTVTAKLAPSVVKLSAFVVEGPREGQARAINQQKSTIGNIAIVAADAIGNFPDQNAAQALERVSGVSVQQLYGQATTVTVRGAGSDLNTSTLDGVAMMGNRSIGTTGSNRSDGRSVALNDFPSQILSSVTVVKTVTPDLDANAIGGTVQLKTKSAFDFTDPVITANAGYQYSSESRKFSPMAGVAFIARFGADKDWGLAFTASEERREGLEEQIEVKAEGVQTYTVSGQAYTGYTSLQPELGNYDYNEHRTAGSVSLEKKFGDTTKLFLRGTDTLWIQKSGRPSLDLVAGTALSPAGPIVVANGNFDLYTMTGVTVQRSVNPRTVSDSSRNASIGGETQLNDWKFNYVANYNRGFGEVAAEGSTWQQSAKATLAYNFSNPYFPTFSEVAGSNIYDPTTFVLNSFKANSILEETHQSTVKLDAERPFDLGAGRLVFKAGGNLRWSELDSVKYAPSYTPATGQTFSMIDPRYAAISESNADFLSRYDLGPSVNPSSFANFALANTNLLTLNAAKTLSADLGGTDTIAEDIAAGYVMGTWTWSHWNVIAGARYESTEDRSQGYQIPATASTDPAAYPLQHFKNRYDNFMPGLLVRYEPEKNLVFRASVTNTLARPDADYLAPTQNITTQPNPTVANPDTVSGGNPSLKATTSINWDTSVDYYFPSIGLVTAGFFYKNISDPVFPNVYTGTFQGEPAVFTAFSNASKAWIRGWELEYQENLTFLPAPFDGLGVYANVTLVNSSVHVPARPTEEFTFFNQANRVGNLGLSYQKRSLYLRLAYNWTGSYLETIDGPGVDEYQAPFRTLDLLATYKFSRNWSVKFTANNLRNSPTISFFGNPTREDVYARDGRFFTCGANWEY